MTRRPQPPTASSRDELRQPSRVTVVMATYNGSSFLAEQLASIEQQTVPPAELVAADDGSTDGTVEILRAFAARAPFPVRVIINQHNVGYAENFLNACRYATTELIALCDQDDVWGRHKLEVSQRELLRSGASLVVHPVHLISTSGEHVGLFSQGIRRRRVAPPLTSDPWGVYYGFTMMFRRELLDLIAPEGRGPHTFEHRGLLSHDLWIYFLATSLRATVEIPTRLAGYRQHSSNQTPHLGPRSLQRLTSSLGKAVDPGVPRNQIAQHRAEMLAEAAGKAAPADAIVMRRAAAFWTSVALHENRRLGLYGHDRAIQRLVHWASLLGRGGYASYRRGGLGGRLAVKDLLAGVLDLRRGENRTSAGVPDSREVGTGRPGASAGAFRLTPRIGRAMDSRHEGVPGQDTQTEPQRAGGI